MLPIFSGLPDAAVDRIRSAITILQAPRASEIFLEAEASDCVYFIVAGFVKVMRGDGSGQHVIAILGPGDIFGELGAILGGSRNASVIALTPCTVVRLGVSEFSHWVDTSPSVASYLVKYLARRIVDADTQIELFRGDIEPRLRYWLQQFRNRGLDAELVLSNAEIARMMGASREAVSRIVSKLRAQGWPGS